MSIDNDEYIDIQVDNLELHDDIDFNEFEEALLNSEEHGLKSHLEDGDKITWYNDPSIVATWHANGRVDVFEKTDISICEANYRIIKGHWRSKEKDSNGKDIEHGVGTEPQHWIFNGRTIKEYMSIFPDFWKATTKPEKTSNKNVAAKKKRVIDNTSVYEPIKVEVADWEIDDFLFYKKVHSPLKSVLCYEVNYSSFIEYSVTIFDKYINNNGVYVMLNDSEPYYVGQADQAFNRVLQHTSDKHSGKWEKALLFVSKNNELTKDYQDVLEMRLIDETTGRGGRIANGTIGNKVNAINVYSTNTLKYDSIIKFIAEASYRLGYSFLVRSTYSNKVVNAIGNAETELAKDESKTNVIVTPGDYVENILNTLPERAFGYGTTILDLAIKDGGFLQSAFKRSFNNKELITRFPDENRRKLYISQFKLFGIIQAATQSDYGIDLYANLNGIVTKEHLIVVDYERELFDSNDKLFKGKALELLAKDIVKRFGDNNMEINYVVGNPPFQIMTGDESHRNTVPIYDKFIEMGITIASENVAMITNNTFFSNDAKADLRRKMIASGLKEMVNYPISGEVFSSVGVSACYFNLDKNNKSHKFNYKCIKNGEISSEYTTILQNDSAIFDDVELMEIRRKCISNINMDSISLGNKAFGIANDFKIGFSGKDRESIETFDNPSSGMIKVLFGTTKNIGTCFIKEADVPKDNEYIHWYKLVTKEVVSKAGINNVSNTVILDTNTINIGGWSVCAVAKDLDTIKNVEKYVKTKFYRMCIMMYSSEGMTHLNNQLYSHIPAFDFTSNKDVDWSLSIDDIDRILFDKFGLTENEKEYIKKIIK